MIELKIRKVGNSLGAVFPREPLTRLHVEEGGRLFLTETPDGYRITPYDPEFERQMMIAEEGLFHPAGARQVTGDGRSDLARSADDRGHS
jgi:putative addiction module antidote